MPYPSDHLCTSQRGHPPLQDFFTLSLSACLLCNEPESFYTPPVFAYLWCEAPSWIPHSPLADSQPLFVFVAPVRKWLRAEHGHVRTAVGKLMKHGL